MRVTSSVDFWTNDRNRRSFCWRRRSSVDSTPFSAMPISTHIRRNSGARLSWSSAATPTLSVPRNLLSTMTRSAKSAGGIDLCVSPPTDAAATNCSFKNVLICSFWSSRRRARVSGQLLPRQSVLTGPSTMNVDQERGSRVRAAAADTPARTTESKSLAPTKASAALANTVWRVTASANR